MKKRLLSMLLIACMVLSMLPMTALAAEADESAEPVVELQSEEVSVVSKTIRHGTALSAEDMISKPDGASTIDFVVGVDASNESKNGTIVITADVAVPEGFTGLDDIDTKEELTTFANTHGVDALKTIVKAMDTAEYYVNKFTNTTTKIKVHSGELSLPSNSGLYLVASYNIVTNNLASGYLIIHPDGVQVSLKWNEEDENNIVTLSKLDDFDLGVTATLSGSEKIEGKDPQDEVESLFIGVDATGDFVILEELTPETVMGVYIQVAFIAHWDNNMFYADPIVRPIIVTPTVAEVTIKDAKGNVNYAQAVDYTGNPYEVGVEVKVNGEVISASEPDLKVRYIGVDTHGSIKGFLSTGEYKGEEAIVPPTESGVYMVVAMYTDKDAGGNLITAGGAIGALVIEPIDSGFDFEKPGEQNKLVADGNGKFPALYNPETEDYAAVVVDRNNNIAYIDLRNADMETITAKVEALANSSVVPTSVQNKLKSLLETYNGFDGDVQMSTIKSELSGIITGLSDEAVLAAYVEKAVFHVLKYAVDMVDADVLLEKISNKVDTWMTTAKGYIPDSAEPYIFTDDDKIQLNIDGAIAYVKDILGSYANEMGMNAADKAAMLNEVESKLKTAYGMVEDKVVATVNPYVQAVVGDSITIDSLDQIAAAVNMVLEVLEKFDITNADHQEKAINVALAMVGPLFADEIDTALTAVDTLIGKADKYVNYIEKLATALAKTANANVEGLVEAVKAYEKLIDDMAAALKHDDPSAEFLTVDSATEMVAEYLYNILVELNAVIENLPDGTLYFNTLPTEPGKTVYAVYALNLSANYKPVLAEAQMKIVCGEHTWGDWIEDPKANCTDDGIKTHTCEICGETETDGTTSLGHDWGTVEYTWTKDDAGYTCTAKRVCKRDNTHVETAEATISSAEKIPATCEDMGTTTYTASFEAGWAEKQFKDVEDIAAKEHDYTYEKDGNKHRQVCQNDPTHVTEWTEHAYGADGKCVCGAEKPVTPEHVCSDYRFNHITWKYDADGNPVSAIGNFTCDDCDEPATVDAIITSETIPATCTEDEKVVYTAIAQLGNTIGTGTCTVTHEGTKLGHDWSDWEAVNSTTHKRICERCDEVEYDTHDFNRKDQCVECGYKKTSTGPCCYMDFSDVNYGDWFYKDVHYVYCNGLMNGIGGGKFGPELTTTRGMIVTILYRLEGEPRVKTDCPFDDVAANKYYEDPITWAAANGIVTGYDADTFGPDDYITREQMAAILYRYANYKGYDTDARARLTKYTDADKISAYAVDAMSWAVAEGLINGMTETTLVPQGNAVRAQVAAILHRFCVNVAKED